MGSSAPLLRRRILCSLIQLGRHRWPLCAPFYSHPYRVAYTRDWIEHNGTGLSATASMVIIGPAMRIIETITRLCSPPDDRGANGSAESLFRRSRSPTLVSRIANLAIAAQLRILFSASWKRRADNSRRRRAAFLGAKAHDPGTRIERNHSNPHYELSADFAALSMFSWDSSASSSWPSREALCSSHPSTALALVFGNVS